MIHVIVNVIIQSVNIIIFIKYCKTSFCEISQKIVLREIEREREIDREKRERERERERQR